MTAQRREGTLTGQRGLRLFWRAWIAPGVPRSVVAIAHGLSEHADRYGHVAERLVSEGHSVWALDHRGHGRSEGARALFDRFDHVVSDLDALIELARAETSPTKLFLLGHSVGGALAVAYATRHQEKLDGLLLSAPLAALEAASPATRLASRLLSAVTPRLGVIGIDASGISRDPEEVRAYERDPLVYHGKVPARTVAELARAVEGFPAEVPRIELPILIMHGTADRIAPPQGSRMLYERVSSADKKLESYEGFYHELVNEPAPDRERVIADLASWLRERASG